jgi:hypothetical protein
MFAVFEDSGGTNVMAVGEPISVSVYLGAIGCLRSTALRGVSSLRVLGW